MPWLGLNSLTNSCDTTADSRLGFEQQYLVDMMRPWLSAEFLSKPVDL